MDLSGGLGERIIGLAEKNLVQPGLDVNVDLFRLA